MFYAEVLSSFYSHLKSESIPEEVLEKSRLSLFDFLAVLITGKFYGSLTPVTKKYIEQKKTGKEATVLSLNTMCTAELAAMAMGIISHSVELDDGHRFGTSHPAVAVIPCSLAISEKNNLSFKDIIKSIVIGYDCMLRLARSINPSHLQRGFHSTGTCGAVGASAAAASLLNYSEELMTYTISMGALQSAGLQEMLHGNPSIKALQPGKAAHAGVLSADFVSLGAKSPKSVFEGFHGWLKAMTDHYDEKSIINDLGSRWEIMYTYTKLYPTCRHCHAAIDMALQLFEEGYNINNIREIKLFTYDVAISEVGQIKNPVNFEEAMFSVAYSIAVALKYGQVRIQELNASLNDKEIKKFANNIKIYSDKLMNQKYPLERGAKINLLNEKNINTEKEVTLPKGEYDTPLARKEYFKKAEVILNEIVPQSFLEELWNLVVENPIDTVDYSDIIKVFKNI